MELALQLTPLSDQEHYSTQALVDCIKVVTELSPITRKFKRAIFRACREGIYEGKYKYSRRFCCNRLGAFAQNLLP